MWRRLYLTFPDSDHARTANAELVASGVAPNHIHALAARDEDLQGLPPATAEQRSDQIWFWEQFYWNGNLAIFAIALLGLIAAVVMGSVGAALIALAVMALTFFSGNYFASNIPHAHLNEMREPLSHGEVVLMVDLPPEQVRQVDDEVRHHHPEAGGHVVGWSLPTLGA